MTCSSSTGRLSGCGTRGDADDGRLLIEHPTGAAEVLIERDAQGTVTGAGTLRTARKLMDGRVFPR